MTYSLILPCYNESSHLEKSFEQILRVLHTSNWDWEIILVDDGSVDTTKKIIASLLKQHPHENIKTILHTQNTGRGKTVADGLKVSSGEIVGFIDVDLEIPPYYIPPFVQRIIEGADIVIAHRIYKLHIHSIVRAMMSKGYAAFTKFFLKLPFQDTEAGYKFFRRSAFLPLLVHIKDSHWFWDTESIAVAYAHNLHVAEIPVIFTRRFEKKSTVRVFHDTVYYIKKIIAFRKQFKRTKLCE